MHVNSGMGIILAICGILKLCSLSLRNFVMFVRFSVEFLMLSFLIAGSGPLIPYGLPCVRELFRFLISLTNPLDRHNTDVMVHMGLSLLTVAHESGADHIAVYSSLLSLVKDDLCKSLFFVSILHYRNNYLLLFHFSINWNLQ